jgi:4-carboxymuconolactone decarboxylase
MTPDRGESAIVERVDEPTAELIRLAAAVAGGSEVEVRRAVERAALGAPPDWAEEVILQSYLFAGFPRALNAMREWRRVSGIAAPRHDGESIEKSLAGFEVRGEITCARVYGDMYDPLRDNVRALHPALDAWMIVAGYGIVLGRPVLDLLRRELCIVAACVASRQERQLLSHFHGTLNVGGSSQLLVETLDALDGTVSVDDLRNARMLLQRVTGK